MNNCRSALGFLISLGLLAGGPQFGTAQQSSSGLAGRPDSSNAAVVTVPGPLNMFQRIAAISRKSSPEEVLAFLARNVVVDGYHHGPGGSRKPTEFLKLLDAYLDHARELQSLADTRGHIVVRGCQDVQPLLQVLGYRLRTACGPGVSLETADPERAFLTVDSGFPLTDLEEHLQEGTVFDYPFGSSEIPMMFGPKDWAWTDQNVLDTLLEDPGLARLYWAFSRLDYNTAMMLRESPGLRRLLDAAPVLDFYGGHLAVRGGKVLVPGGPAAERGWADLVGVSPASPAQFLTRLLTADGGWLAAYFDALWYVPKKQREYFSDPGRLKRYYEALRGKELEPSPARSVFRPTASLYLLTSRLLLDAQGRPHIPGNLEVWKEIFRRKSSNRTVRDWAKQSGSWRQPEQLLEAMMNLSRVPSPDGPLQVYLQLIEIDRQRGPGRHLSAATVREMAENFTRYRDQFLLFTEFNHLDDNSVMKFISTARAIDDIRDKAVRANALGLFQANLGLWQILARQDQIPALNWNVSFQDVIRPFSEISNATQLHDASRSSLSAVWQSAGGSGPITQAGLISLLAGPPQSEPEAQAVQGKIVDQISSVLDSQRLISLNTLLELSDGLTRLAEGQPASDSLIRLAGVLDEFEKPLPIFTNRERSEWASGLQHNPHSSLQVRYNLAREIAKPNLSPKDREEARGTLTPYLRDVLVGLNYAYYEPPGAQMIRYNPLFVRSHNFSGLMTMKGDEVWQTPRVLGRGWSASGGAHLAGSISDLPYVLAQVEQDFIVPENVQSLIWADLVPTMLTSSILPRWWDISRAELQAVALYQELGEALLTSAAQREDLRDLVVESLGEHMLPRRQADIESSLRAGLVDKLLEEIMPSEIFFLGIKFFEQYPEEAARASQASVRLSELRRQFPEDVSREKISRDFGVPHPRLANTYARELLEMKPLPTFLGYSSRLMAESWESSNLYWARLAAEQGHHPAVLNELVPSLTHRMVEKIFATHLEDWPAVLRALRETGHEFRLGKDSESSAASAQRGM